MRSKFNCACINLYQTGHIVFNRLREQEVMDGADSVDTKSDDEYYFQHPPVAHIPKDPRTKYKYNVFCRILFL